MLTRISKGVARAQGSRPYQEDNFAIADEAFDRNGFALYSVFDGHGGSDASQHAARNLPKLVVNSDSFKQGRYDQALRDAFLREDELLLEEFGNARRGGTTATVALIAQSQLYVANVGDSTAVLARKNDQGNYDAVRLSKEHKVDDAVEAKRLSQADAKIRNDRVVAPGHAINMTRALGDFDFKLPENGAPADWISPVPHVSKVDLQPNADFAIIASDGLWNHLDEVRLIPMIAEMRLKGLTPQQICVEFTANLGKIQGSDNITFILLDLHWGAE
ncbi:phosphatase 2C-like domain-containing protein [Phlyctochytrium arcticum]|nr:phosphatase 2C-like domain-containing protein [Phlyctochytrium arcticum]